MTRTFLIFACAILCHVTKGDGQHQTVQHRQLRNGDSMEAGWESPDCNYCRTHWDLKYSKHECHYNSEAYGCIMHYAEAMNACKHVCTFSYHTQLRVTNYYNFKSNELTAISASIPYTNSEVELNNIEDSFQQLLELATLTKFVPGVNWCHTIIASINARRQQLQQYYYGGNYSNISAELYRRDILHW